MRKRKSFLIASLFPIEILAGKKTPNCEKIKVNNYN